MSCESVRRHLDYFQPKELWPASTSTISCLIRIRMRCTETAHIEASPPLHIRALMLLGRLREQLDHLLRSRSHLYHLMRQRAKVLLRSVGIYTPMMQPDAAFAFSSAASQAAWAATRAAILEMRDESARHGVRFAVLILPRTPRPRRPPRSGIAGSFISVSMRILRRGSVQERICQELTTLAIECVDALPLFRAHPDQQLFLRVYGDSIDYLHTNAAGHELLAEALFRAIQSRLLPDASAPATQHHASLP